MSQPIGDEHRGVYGDDLRFSNLLVLKRARLFKGLNRSATA